MGRAGEVPQPRASWDLQDHSPPGQGRNHLPSQPAQEMTSSAQTIVEVGEQVRVETSALQRSAPGRPEASSRRTGCHSPAPLAVGTPGGQPARPAQQ